MARDETKEGGEVRQLDLVPRPVAAAPDGIDLRCCDVAELLDEVEGASLVVADPPWSYRNAGAEGNADTQYELLTNAAILEHVDEAYTSASENAYLALWCTWPKLDEWMTCAHLGASRPSPWLRWSYVSGGAWTKSHGLGVGFHWRGDSEPLLLYRKGKPRALATASNAHATPRRLILHSEKPLSWARDHVRAWCPPGGLVLDLYAGMAPYARACHLEGRRYIGAEIDPKRHADALGLLAQVRND